MQRLLASFVLVCSVLALSTRECSAFQVPSSGSRTFGMREVGITSQQQQLQQKQFRVGFAGIATVLAAAEDEEKKTEEVVDIETPSSFLESSSSGSGGWVDPDAGANTSPKLSWWGWILALYPTALLLDDVFHFWPKEGPISLLKI